MKTSKLRYSTLILFAFLFSSMSYGQVNSEEWKIIHEENGVKFFGKEIYCTNDSEEKPSFYAFLKIENTNSQEVRLIYTLAMEFEEGCSGCDLDSEFGTTITIPAQGTVEADCSLSQPSLYRIIRNLNLPGGWEYQSMKIVNLIID